MKFSRPSLRRTLTRRPAGQPDLPTFEPSPAHYEHPPTPLNVPRLHAFDFHSAVLPDPHTRTILVYLPHQYEAEPDRRFPVLYLHDGQNLFDDRTSYVPGRTWRAHTTADDLTLAGQIEPLILVGIANTGLRRMAEYTPTPDYKMGGGEGRLYARLLLEELKPRIDTRFRTLPSPAHTAVGGSSLGGLISLFLGLEHPEAFSRLAILSPSLWWDHRSIFALVERSHPNPLPRIWLDIGTAEGTRHLRDTDLLQRVLLRRGWHDTPTSAPPNLRYTRAENAVHDEDAWAARFPDVLRFLFPPEPISPLHEGATSHDESSSFETPGLRHNWRNERV